MIGIPERELPSDASAGLRPGSGENHDVEETQFDFKLSEGHTKSCWMDCRARFQLYSLRALEETDFWATLLGFRSGLR